MNLKKYKNQGAGHLEKYLKFDAKLTIKYI